MTKTWKDPPVEKLYYTTGEVARSLGVTASAIRYWLDCFGLHSIKKNYNIRKIPVATFKTLVSINRLSTEGFYTLKGIARELQLPAPKLLPNGTTINTTESSPVLGELRPGHGAKAAAEDGPACSGEDEYSSSQGRGVLWRSSLGGDS